jgi:hypothetical protein
VSARIAIKSARFKNARLWVTLRTSARIRFGPAGKRVDSGLGRGPTRPVEHSARHQSPQPGLADWPRETDRIGTCCTHGQSGAETPSQTRLSFLTRVFGLGIRSPKADRAGSFGSGGCGGRSEWSQGTEAADEDGTKCRRLHEDSEDCRFAARAIFAIFVQSSCNRSRNASIGCMSGVPMRTASRWSLEPGCGCGRRGTLPPFRSGHRPNRARPRRAMCFLRLNHAIKSSGLVECESEGRYPDF